MTDKPVKNINTLLIEGYRKKDAKDAENASVKNAPQEQ